MSDDGWRDGIRVQPCSQKERHGEHGHIVTAQRYDGIGPDGHTRSAPINVLCQCPGIYWPKFADGPVAASPVPETQ